MIIQPHSRGIRWSPLLFSTLAIASFASNAVAQTTETSSAPAPSAASAAPDSPAILEARERQQRGRALIAARDFNGALAEFQRVYELLDGHPRRYLALSNIAAAYQGLAQYDRAMEYYERFLREAPADAEDRPRVEAAVAALEDLLGTVVVNVTGAPRAEIWVDNRQMGTAPGRVRMPGGRHSIEVRAAGFLPARREAQLSAHETVNLNIAMERAGRGLPPVIFGIGAGLTVAAGATAIVFGTLALAGRSDVDQRSLDPIRMFTITQDDRDRIAQMAILSDAFTITAGVLAAGTIVVAVLTDWRGRPAERAPTRAMRPRWGAIAAPGMAGIQLSGAF